MKSLKNLGLSVFMFIGACSSASVIPALAFEWPWEARTKAQESLENHTLYVGSPSTEKTSHNRRRGVETPPSYTQEDVSCMAEAIYFEARGEPIAGQAAVGLVILERVRSGRYPSSVCGVISQNDHRFNKCMFSYRCDGKSEHISKENNIAYNLAVSVSECVLDGECNMVGIDQATMYYACDGENTISRPDWDFDKLRTMGKLSNHCFFKEV